MGSAEPEVEVSAIIIVRDGERFLAEAIESILAQTVRPEQVIVVDNGSADDSAAIAGSYGPPVEVVSEPVSGIGPARNAGLAQATGGFIGFLDYDDIWEPQKTELQLAAMSADPELDLVMGHVIQFVPPEFARAGGEKVRIPAEPQPGQHLGSMLGRRRAWERVGPFPVDVNVGDGLVWFTRAKNLGLKELTLPQVMMRRRILGANHSLRNAAGRGEMARILKDSIDQRRGRSGP